ncbi:MAG TPA: DNA cytosine methyltransferase [Novosphingobium sp.]|nr:DNA cytosine methyltransferase [Novosphingobium sp.]
MRAIDLYSGIGGWSAGLACAGIEVVEAYEIWPAAMNTYNANLGADHVVSDVRALILDELPRDISLVVGSPPCTEFSYSNRGGGGDIGEGLKDIVKFFEVIRHVKPTAWIMENVPRTAAMIRSGLCTAGHPLFEFRDLAPDIEILDFAAFGLSQSRSRCLVGVFPFERLREMRDYRPRSTLGDVICALESQEDVVDPHWGIVLRRDQLTEMEPELPLNAEQLRMNREAKRFHPVYNDMPFPDTLDRPSRTVTATCTRVSRESIVVPADDLQSVRRLTVRERATLQGFPITYQFYGNSHSQKVKMIGNAVPPLFAYMVGMAAQGLQGQGDFVCEHLPAPLVLPTEFPDVTPPHAVGTDYPVRRRFRVALPGLRFKSGVRFQLSNSFEGGIAAWTIEFFFGPSKQIRSVTLDRALHDSLRRIPFIEAAVRASLAQLKPVRAVVECYSPEKMQRAWRQSEPVAGPYALVDQLGQAGIALTHAFSSSGGEGVVEAMLAACADPAGNVASKEKLAKNAPAILAGLVLGSWFNCLPWADDEVVSRPLGIVASVG